MSTQAKEEQKKAHPQDASSIGLDQEDKEQLKTMNERLTALQNKGWKISRDFTEEKTTEGSLSHSFSLKVIGINSETSITVSNNDESSTIVSSEAVTGPLLSFSPQKTYSFTSPFLKRKRDSKSHVAREFLKLSGYAFLLLQLGELSLMGLLLALKCLGKPGHIQKFCKFAISLNCIGNVTVSPNIL